MTASGDAGAICLTALRTSSLLSGVPRTMFRLGRGEIAAGLRASAVTLCPAGCQSDMLWESGSNCDHAPLLRASSTTSWPVRPVAPMTRTCIAQAVGKGTCYVCFGFDVVASLQLSVCRRCGQGHDRGGGFIGMSILLALRCPGSRSFPYRPTNFVRSGSRLARFGTSSAIATQSHRRPRSGPEVGASNGARKLCGNLSVDTCSAACMSNREARTSSTSRTIRSRPSARGILAKDREPRAKGRAGERASEHRGAHNMRDQTRCARCACAASLIRHGSSSEVFIPRIHHGSRSYHRWRWAWRAHVGVVSAQTERSSPPAGAAEPRVRLWRRVDAFAECAPRLGQHRRVYAPQAQGIQLRHADLSHGWHV